MRKALLLFCSIAAGAASGTVWAEETAEQAPPDACISTDHEVSDSSAWALAAVDLFTNQQYAEAVETVNACFKMWGPEAGQQQKKLWDTGKKCPKSGEVSQRVKRKIDENGLINDVSLALWAKSRSLHELGETEAAKKSYGQCIYMACGRAWDPQGWYWNPAEDCAEQAQELLEAEGAGDD